MRRIDPTAVAKAILVGFVVLGPARVAPILAEPQAATRLEFEVASIRPPNPTGDRGTNMSTDGGTLRMHNATLKFCIVAAYGVQESLIEGGPGWIKSDQFEILAKAPGSTRQDQLVLMLQSLLVDRFKLSVHREIKPRPIFALVVGKNGPKLHASDGGEGFLGRRGRGPLTGKQASMPGLASVLSTIMGRKVLDQTGLTGLYDFTLEFAPQDAIDSPLPSLVTALQEQLGLRLEATNAPVEILVVDHAEKPAQD
jgi:uncharacterized protein (TIGR03435 family)